MTVETEEPNFKLTFRNGQNGFFVRSSGEGFVLGPRNPKAGRDDHVTIVVRGGNFKEVHRKVDGLKQWGYRSEQLSHGMQDLASKAETMEPSSLLSAPTYIVSWNRVVLAFRFFEVFAGFWFWLFGRRLLSIDEARLKDSKVVTIRFKQKELKKVFVRLKKFLGPMSPFVIWLGARIGPKVMKRFGSFFLINPANPGRLQDDIGLVVSQQRTGIVWIGKERKLSFIPLPVLLEAYQSAESKLPFESISELVDVFQPGAEISVKGT